MNIPHKIRVERFDSLAPDIVAEPRIRPSHDRVRFCQIPAIYHLDLFEEVLHVYVDLGSVLESSAVLYAPEAPEARVLLVLLIFVYTVMFLFVASVVWST
jgi:hypothetical protein